ncbi:MAG TPA: ABC transporter substrate-binding protein [Rhodothermales bacterium]
MTGTIVLTLVAAVPAQAQDSLDASIRIGFVAPGPGVDSTIRHAAIRGAQMGATEALRMAMLLGRGLELVTVEFGEGGPNSAVDRLVDLGAFAVVGGYDSRECRELAEASERAGLLFFNAGCRDDELRGSSCRRTTFHVAMSDAMAEDAVGMSDRARTVVEWHPGLFRFGARQVNDRFLKRYGEAMTAEAWTTWLAVKVLAETAMRLPALDRSALIAHFESDVVRIDGHKGVPLSFRSWDHQLRQSLYRLDAGGEIVDTVPGDADDADPRLALDQLGTSATETGCRFEP